MVIQSDLFNATAVQTIVVCALTYRAFGRTGLPVFPIAMGCNRLGDPGVDMAVWPRLVERAIALGVTFFDTAMAYNDGRSGAGSRSGRCNEDH